MKAIGRFAKLKRKIEMKSPEQKFTKIPKGYRITIESYENDGDFGDTTVIEGLSEDAVKNVVALCTVMKTEHGNLYYPSDEQKVKLFNILNRIFNCVSDYIVTEDNLEEYEDDFYNILAETGFIGKEQDQFTRYCKVEYLPEDVFIEDVTERFGF